MPRAINNVAAKKRHKKILKLAKGYRLGKSKLYRTAKDQVENGLSYSKFIHLLNQKDVNLNRKVLADMAFQNPDAFAALVKHVQG